MNREHELAVVVHFMPCGEIWKFGLCRRAQLRKAFIAHAGRLPLLGGAGNVSANFVTQMFQSFKVQTWVPFVWNRVCVVTRTLG